MRLDSVLVDIGPSARKSGETYVIRSAQQIVGFYKGPNPYSRVKFSLDNGATWTPERSWWGYFIYWNPWHPGGILGGDIGPNRLAFGPNRILIDYYLEDGKHVQEDITIVVVRPAQRRFVSSDSKITYVPGPGAENAPTTINHSTMLLWTTGQNTYEQLDRPLLVVEGVDAEQRNSAGTYLALGSQPYGGADASVAPLFERVLHASVGADIAILDFADGGASMVHNAGVVQGAVRLLRQIRSNQAVGFDVAGVSMGGVVARYALAAMESQEAHNVAHFVSLDAPQQGAVLDESLQQHIKNKGQPAPKVLSSPAGKELLQVNLFDASIPKRYVSFYNTLHGLNGGLGYPALSQNIGVSFGSPSPNPGAAGSQVWLTIKTILPDVNFQVTGSVAQAGSYLPREQASFWGRVFVWAFNFLPLNTTFNLVRSNDYHPTFIPFASALDLSVSSSCVDAACSNSAFNGGVLYPPTATFHDDIPAAIIEPLVARLGYLTPPVPPTLALSGPYNVPANPGTWTASLSTPAAYGFTFSWRYRLDLTGACGIDDEPLLRSEPTSQKKPGGGETNLINQCVWTNGPSGPTFSYSIAGNAWLDVEVTATNGSQTVTTTRRVTYGSPGGGGGPLAASPSTEGLSLNTEGEAEAIAAFEVTGVRPSVVRSGGRVWVDYALPEASEVHIIVHDVLGRVRHRATEARPAGRHRADVSLAGFDAGVYLVTVRAGGAQRTVRFIVQ